MSGINKVILVGHLGKDPEVRHLEGGATVATFPLATSETYTKNGERVEQTEWHNIVTWRGLAEIAEKYLRKGKLVYIEGKIRTRSYDDKEGNKRYVTEIVADSMTMLGRKSDQTDESVSYERNEKRSNDTASGDALNANAETPEDDLPF